MGAEAEEELARPSTAADGSAEMMLPDRNDGGYQTGVARRRAMYLRASGEERGNGRRQPMGGGEAGKGGGVGCGQAGSRDRKTTAADKGRSSVQQNK